MMQTARSVTFKGKAATIKRGYQVAANLAAWSLELMGDQGWRCTAVVVDQDEFWLDQDGLALCMQIGRGAWKWPDVTIYRNEGGEIEMMGTSRPEVS